MGAALGAALGAAVRRGAPLVAPLAAALALAGCAAPTIPVPTTVVTPGMPNPEDALRQSIRHVDAEMAELGGLGPRVETPSTPVVPEDLQRIVSFDWSGPLDQGVAKLAASIGYTFYTSGPPNLKPLLVSIQINSVPVYRVFHTLGEEAGASATVLVDPQTHQVQVIHHV